LYNNILSNFENNYAYDLILECFGQESQLYAEDFKITESLYQKYLNIIEKNIDIIKDKTVVDIGAGTGVWSILMLMAGAKCVASIEPRQQLSNGLKRFVEKHKLNIECVTDFHTSVSGVYDTAILSGILGLIPERIEYLEQLGKQVQYIFIRNAVYEIPKDCVEVKLRHNHNYMQGYNPHDKVLNDLGYQTSAKLMNNINIGQYLKHKFGTNYFNTVSNYLGYSVHKKYITNGNQHWVLKTR